MYYPVCRVRPVAKNQVSTRYLNLDGFDRRTRCLFGAREDECRCAEENVLVQGGFWSEG